MACFEQNEEEITVHEVTLSLTGGFAFFTSLLELCYTIMSIT